MRFKIQVTTCSDFPSEALLWIKEVEMVDSLDESESSRSIAGKNFPNFEMLEARSASALNKIIQASAKRTQADLGDSLMSSSSQEPRAQGRRDAMFASGSEEPGNQFKSSVFKHADPSNLGKSLLEGNKDDLFHQARSDLMKQEHQVGSLNDCISELQQQAYARRLELQDAQHGYIESRREQVRLQEEVSLKEKVLRDTGIRSMHEMGEMKRAQELRVDEVSVQKLREDHETLQ